MHLSLLLTLIPFLGLVSANPTPRNLVPRQNANTSCGSNKYTISQLSAALSAGCSYWQAGKTVGSDRYPHAYNDYEGFNFGGVAGPYLEFPLLESKVYKSGSPGADRVIFTQDNCTFVGTITHTGAKGNNFVGCSGTS